MRSWSFKYFKWRLTTAYPKGWKYALMHPLKLSNDIWRYLYWCQRYDYDIRRKNAKSKN